MFLNEISKKKKIVLFQENQLHPYVKIALHIHVTF